MASTLRLNDAFDWVKFMVKNMPLETVKLRLMQDVLSIMWMAAPWRWSVGTLNTVTLNGAQDYPYSYPNDFLYLLSAYITDGKSTYIDLHVEPDLPVAGLVGQPSRICVIPPQGNLRLYPGPNSFPNPHYLITLYKRMAPVLTNGNIAGVGTQLFDDEWYWVFEEGVLWKAYQYADDARAGSATMTSDGKYQYTGQRGVFEAALVQMKEREKMPIFFNRAAPEKEAVNK